MTIEQLQFPSVRHLVSEAEWHTRVDLAAAYRLVALFGWDDIIFTHLTAKIAGSDHFLINPYGVICGLSDPQHRACGAPRRALRHAHPLGQWHRCFCAGGGVAV